MERGSVNDSALIDQVDRTIAAMAAARDDSAVAAVLSESKDAALKPIKEKLRESRKPRLRTVEQYLCDNCDGIIREPHDGFVIHGNVYVADPSSLGGLIGNNFPDEGKLEDVKKTVLCKRCFCKALNLQSDTDTARQAKK